MQFSDLYYKYLFKQTSLEEWNKFRRIFAIFSLCIRFASPGIDRKKFCLLYDCNYSFE
jgi:hypothetical protein